MGLFYNSASKQGSIGNNGLGKLRVEAFSSDDKASYALSTEAQHDVLEGETSFFGSVQALVRVYVAEGKSYVVNQKDSFNTAIRATQVGGKDVPYVGSFWLAPLYAPYYSIRPAFNLQISSQNQWRTIQVDGKFERLPLDERMRNEIRERPRVIGTVGLGRQDAVEFEHIPGKKFVLVESSGASSDVWFSGEPRPGFNRTVNSTYGADVQAVLAVEVTTSSD